MGALEMKRRVDRAHPGSKGQGLKYRRRRASLSSFYGKPDTEEVRLQDLQREPDGAFGIGGKDPVDPAVAF